MELKDLYTLEDDLTITEAEQIQEIISSKEDKKESKDEEWIEEKQKRSSFISLELNTALPTFSMI